MHYISFRTVSSSVFLVLSTDDALRSAWWQLKAGQVNSGLWYQGDQPGDEIQRFEYHMGCAIGMPSWSQRPLDLFQYSRALKRAVRNGLASMGPAVQVPERDQPGFSGPGMESPVLTYR